MKKHASDWAPEAPTPAQLKELFAQIESGRINKSRLQTFLREKVGRLLFVDYDISISTLVKEGNYQGVTREINDRNFQTKRTGQAEMEIKLFYFHVTKKAEEVIAAMEREGYLPAEFHDLMFFGIQNPEEQVRYPIAGLGSVWVDVDGTGGKYAIAISDSRSVTLRCYDGYWGTGYRFLGVRRS